MFEHVLKSESLVEEGLRIRKPTRTRKSRRTDFQEAAGMLLLVSRLTRREQGILLARALHGSDRDTARFLRPRHPSFDRQISEFYRRKLRPLLEGFRSGDPDRAKMACILRRVMGQPTRF